MAVVEVKGLDADGDALAAPVTWPEDAPPPVIHMAPQGAATTPSVRAIGWLARLKPLGRHAYEGRVMRLIGARPREILGVYERVGQDGRIRPTTAATGPNTPSPRPTPPKPGPASWCWPR